MVFFGIKRMDAKIVKKNIWKRALFVFFERLVVPKKVRDQFLLVFAGHIFFQTLYAAVKFDLFTILDDVGKLTREEIAAKLGLEIQPTRILLLGLCSCGLLKKRRNYYRNSMIAKKVLSRNSDRNLLNYVELQGRVVYCCMPHFYDALKAFDNLGLQELKGSENTLYERLGHNLEDQQIFQNAMQELSLFANQDLCNMIDFSSVNSIVDIGGGDGTNLISLARSYPSLKGTIYDLDTVCPLAESKIKAAKLADRLRVQVGNCFKDPLPEDVDCFLLAHFMTIWSPEESLSLLRKCYQALPPDGKVVIFNMMQSDEETGPIAAAVGSPYFITIATGKGMLYSWMDYESWLKKAGFSKVDRHRLPYDHGVVVGTK